MWVRPLDGEDPKESHGQRSLGAAVHGVTESQTRQQLNAHTISEQRGNEDKASLVL